MRHFWLCVLLVCTLGVGGCVDAIILGAIWWDCGIMATSFSDCRSLRKPPEQAPPLVIERRIEETP